MSFFDLVVYVASLHIALEALARRMQPKHRLYSQQPIKLHFSLMYGVSEFL